MKTNASVCHQCRYALKVHREHLKTSNADQKKLLNGYYWKLWHNKHSRAMQNLLPIKMIHDWIYGMVL